jgi:hypothetical protein
MRLRALAVALGLAALAFAACTTFDGLSARIVDGGGGGDASQVDSDTAPDGAQKGTTFLGLDDAIRLCALAVKCPQLSKSIQASLAIPIDNLNFSLCVDWLAGPVPPNRIGVTMQATELACAAKGQSCVAALACLSQEFTDDNDSRCAGIPLDGGKDATSGFYQYCDDAGGVVRCDPQFLHDVLHCTSAYYAPASKCMVGNDGTKTCSTGSDCPATACNGNLLVFCGTNGTHQGENCAIEGFTCGNDVTDDSGIPTCLTSDRVKACTTQGTDCVGTVASVCDGFTRSEYDCAALRGSCTKAAGTARCKREGDHCAPEDANVNQCTGNQIAL